MDDGRWLTRHREWYLDTLKLWDDGSEIYAIYSMTLKSLYGEDIYLLFVLNRWNVFNEFV